VLTNVLTAVTHVVLRLAFALRWRMTRALCWAKVLWSLASLRISGTVSGKRKKTKTTSNFMEGGLGVWRLCLY
jgi:hypothetical protein